MDTTRVQKILGFYNGELNGNGFMPKLNYTNYIFIYLIIKFKQ